MKEAGLDAARLSAAGYGEFHPLNANDTEAHRARNRRVDLVLDELRRRLGSTFTAEELADQYGEDTSWADELSGMESWIVDAAFYRYLREARNYAGGRATAEPDPT